MIDFYDYLDHCRQRVNYSIEKQLPSVHKVPCQLHKAMRYAVLNGGKRVRAALVYATGEALGADGRVLDKASTAIELIHAFSLVHDDLPAIDNDDLRRGKPACHKKFDEATAILAGDALLVLSFRVLSGISQRQLAPEINLKMIQILSNYVGSCGMAGGEMLDTALQDQTITLRKLAFIYKLKTSYLICASILLGALSANCQDPKLLANLEKFGLYAGLAFQIHDDIIGIEVDTATLGKPQGSDITNKKPTYPQLIGLDQAKRQKKIYFDKALHFLEQTQLKYEKLTCLTQFIIQRIN